MTAIKTVPHVNIGGQVRKQFVVQEGWLESLPDVMPADSHVAQLKICTDSNGDTRRLFKICLRPSVVAALAAKALATITEVHNDDVAASDRALLRRKHSQRLR